MKLAIVGTGYVGLVAGVGFAESGNDVICVDKMEDKVRSLSEGKVTIHEPGVGSLLQRNLAEGRLSFTTDLEYAVRNSYVVFIAVGTPPGEDGSADLSHVLDVAEGIGRYMDGYRIIVSKSTVPVGTSEKVRAKVESMSSHPFDVVSNPEFLKEGAALGDFMKPDRIVVGTRSERAREVLKELYSPFLRTMNPILFMDERSAEMTKYACNAMLAARISFINEIANLCDLVGADVHMVRMGMGTDPRIGNKFLFPGIGYGGSCFPKDVAALMRTGHEHGYPLRVLEAVHAVNRDQRKLMARKCVLHFGGRLDGKVIAMWGLAFKANTDDMREAPATVIIRELLDHGARVVGFDPAAMESAQEIFGETITYAQNAYAAVEGADGLIVSTEWNEFRTPDFPRIRRMMRGNVLFDGRNLYSPERIKEYGFRYYSIGRGVC
ncbi:MAG: UDP-glucose/GDP-mannose dehydrogenase family protein [Deltaproteobacteria bacterium]|nr:UDP-glucose/GDP-mannose dehydrogenase family protein [Deltaproteobacteria bacterium]